MMQYESQGLGAQCPAGLSLEPVTTKWCLLSSWMMPEHCNPRSPPVLRVALPCWAKGLHHHLDMQSIAHLSLASGGNDNSSGGALPLSLLAPSLMVLPPEHSKPITAECCTACLFATPA